MKKLFRHFWPVVVLAVGGVGLAPAATTSLGSFAALRVAITGKPHTCVATALNASTAHVFCELGPRQHRFYSDYTAPLSWIKDNFAQGQTNPVPVWISGGYDASGLPLGPVGPASSHS